MKKLLASVIILLLLLSVCLIAAFPASAADVNYDDFEIYDGVLVEYIGPGGAVEIPSVDREGNPVTHIDTRAFYGNTDVTSIVIPEGIETMGNSVFEGCTNLVEVSLPYSLKEAEYNTFKSTGIMSIVIPGQLKNVPSSFIVAPCADIVISPGVEVIESGALYTGVCPEIIFPDSVYQVYAFAMCYYHTDVSLYFCNPEVELGTPGHHGWSETETGPIIWARAGTKPEIKFYSLDDSAVEEYVKEYQNGDELIDGGLKHCAARFIPIKQDKIDEYQAAAEKNGITSAPVVDDGGDKTGSEQTGDKNNSGNTNGNNQGTNGGNNANANNAGSDNTLLIVIIIAVVVFFMMIIIVLVIVMVMMNKKNKKKKKVKAAEPVAEVTAEEPVAEESAEEEKGEEE